MTFRTAHGIFAYGAYPWRYTSSAYCVNNTSASDYGKCYNITEGKAIFVQSDTTTYPAGSLQCEKDGTCTRYTSTSYVLILDTVFSYTGKQGILQYFWSRSHSPKGIVSTNVSEFELVPLPTSVTPEFGWFLPAPNYETSSWPIYDPVANFKVYFNPYSISSGNVVIVRWQGTYFETSLNISAYFVGFNNVWMAGDVLVNWAYESSPLAIIPLDYNNDYAPYQELRNAFGYAATGIDQPGWNAQDIIAALRDIYPNKAWAVFDDKTYTLYLYNLTMDYVPDWLINKLAPVGVKVLQPPSDSSIAQAWLNGLNARNPQIPPPPSSP